MTTDELPSIEGVLQAEGAQILEHISDVPLDPGLLGRLFAASPLAMTNEQRAVVVEELRRKRKELGVKKAARKKKPAKQVEGQLTLADLNIDVSKIGIKP